MKPDSTIIHKTHEKATPNPKNGCRGTEKCAGMIAMLPECIVLDEPTAMLDPKGRKEVLETIRKLNRERGITIVFITHFMEEAATADRVVVMDNAKILLDGTPKEVFRKADLLKQVGLDVPKAACLAAELKKEGVPMPDDILTAAEFSDAILNLLGEKSNADS